MNSLAFSCASLAACIFGVAGVAACNNVTVAVSPNPAEVLTCSTQTFTAAVAGAPDGTKVSWAASPGTIDQKGTYTAPTAMPADAKATITASAAGADGSVDAQVQTAFPSAPTAIAGSTGDGRGVFPHAVAAQGARVYAVWSGPEAAQGTVLVAKSDDAGKTWGAGVAAITLDFGGSTSSLDCDAIAIDAGNPDVVYVVAQTGSASDLGAAAAGSQDASGGTVFAVSTDGGATFTQHALWVGGPGGVDGWTTGGVSCADIASPKASTVVVVVPGGAAGDGNPDMAVFADASEGAGFATGTQGANGNVGYVAEGVSHALEALAADRSIAVASNGGTDAAGGAGEAPRLFVDGAGQVCVTYDGIVEVPGDFQSNAYVQCSNDDGATFSAPLKLDPEQPVGQGISSPVGAFGKAGAAAVAWNNGDVLELALSTDGGKTFAAQKAVPTYVIPGATAGRVFNPDIAYDANGVLWLAYVPDDGGTHSRVVVDKSCDGGTSFSGGVLVNGPESSIADMRFPALAMTPGETPTISAAASDHVAVFSLAPNAP